MAHEELSRTFDADLRIEGEPVAFFGRWEPGEEKRDRELFAEFESWARKIGATRVFGPIDSSTHGMYRLQISDFDSHETFPGEPRNSPAAPARLRALGYRVAQTYVTSWSSRISELREWTTAASRGPLGSLAPGFNVRALSQEYCTARAEDLRAAVNDIFSENFAYTPIDELTFSALFGGSFLRAVCPRTSFVVEDPSGAVAALCVCLPGTESPEGRTLYVKTVGIVSRFRGRGVSLVALILEILSRAQDYNRVALCLMREGNFPSLLLKPLIESERRYALFAKDLHI
jgi:hypothetical protein